MQRISIRSLSVAMIAISAITASFAQSVSYVDRDGHPASAKSYAFKRVIKYKEQIYIPHSTTDRYGIQHIDQNPSGLHICSLTDYFPSGEPALVANIFSQQPSCDQWSFKGKVIYYYRSGRIRKTEFYQPAGILEGDAITYAEDGRIVTKEHYEGGQSIDTDKYQVAANHPLAGKWKRRCVDDDSAFNTCTQSRLLWTISPNGILYTQSLGENPAENWEGQTNWKYTSTGPATGVLEEFQGKTLVERGNIRWMSKNEFEDTIAFSPNPDVIGERFRFVREWRDGIR